MGLTPRCTQVAHKSHTACATTQQGRVGTFADFAAASVAALAATERLQSLSSLQPTLQRYPALPPSERQRIASQLMKTLTKLATHNVAGGAPESNGVSESNGVPHGNGAHAATPPPSPQQHPFLKRADPFPAARPVLPASSPAPTTAEFREQFHKTAIALASASNSTAGHTAASMVFNTTAASTTTGPHVPSIDGVFQGDQRTDAWHALRDRRLTASAFGNALGFFRGSRTELWEEKVGLRPKFAGNAATQWGTRREPEALQLYEEITGQQVLPCMFRVRRSDDVHGWLGASPDGLVAGMGSSGEGGGGQVVVGEQGRQVVVGEQGRVSVHVPGFVVEGACVMAGMGDGLVEIKCPYNKGNVMNAVAPFQPQWYV